MIRKAKIKEKRKSTLSRFMLTQVIILAIIYYIGNIVHYSFFLTHGEEGGGVMRAHVRSNLVFLKKGGGEAFKEIESYYQRWLSFSGLSEEMLLQFGKIHNLTIIQSHGENGTLSTKLGLMSDHGFMPLGQPFISAERKNNRQYEVDLALVLFYIAEKLDRADSSGDSEKEYFHNCVSHFLSSHKQLYY